MSDAIKTPEELIAIRRKTTGPVVRTTPAMCYGCMALIRCVQCSFRDQLSRQEFEASGLCQACQDILWNEQGLPRHPELWKEGEGDTNDHNG